MDVLHDPALTWTDARASLFGGDVHLLSPTPASLALADAVHARLVDAVGADPRRARQRMSNEAFFRAFSAPRRGLGRDPVVRALAARVLAGWGCEPAHSLVDLPRVRAVPSDAHLVPEAAPAYGLHRDAWYANPRAQVNGWLAVHDVEREEMFGLLPAYFDRPVANSSDRFDYAAWTSSGGFQAYADARPSTQVHPTVTEDVDRSGVVRLRVPRGAVLRFAGAHLHGTWPHSSGFVRYSLELRVVDARDAAGGRGAPAPDDRSRGDASVDYLRWDELVAGPGQE